MSGSATGSITRGAFSATTFESLAAVAQTTTVALVLSNASGSVPSNGTSVNYFEPVTYQPLGTSAPGLWAVATSRSPLPASAKAGDSGPWYSMTNYTSSSKSTQIGTTVATYSVQADGASSAVLSISTTLTPTSGAGTTVVSTFRLGTTGAAVPLQQTTNGPGVSTTLTYR